jgi:hypothetical protein
MPPPSWELRPAIERCFLMFYWSLLGLVGTMLAMGIANFFLSN